MTHYVAIVEDAGPDKAVSVWFPDLPGCFSAGDTMDEALVNEPEAVLLYAEALEQVGRHLPKARILSELKEDAASTADARGNLIAILPLPQFAASTAE